MLLTGDMSADGELQWLEQKDTLEKPVQILKIAHHGSGYSSTEPFLKEVSPKLAVISCGEGNRYGHPHVETLERLGKRGDSVGVYQGLRGGSGRDKEEKCTGSYL